MPRAPTDVRPLGLRLLLAALVLLAAAFGAGPAPRGLAGPPRLGELVERYKATLGRHDDVAYASERETATAIADLDTPEARRALTALAVTERDLDAGCDAKRMAILLGALVRRGGASEFEFAIQTVEGSRCRGLDTALPRILGSVVASHSRAYLRGVVLVKGTVAMRTAAAQAIGAICDQEALLPLLAVLREDHVLLRAEALFALGELHEDGAVPAMTVFLAGDDPRLREVAARALGVLGSAKAVPALVRALDDAEARVTESAANALALLAPDGAAVSVPAILDRWAKTKGKDERLEDGFERALARITGVEMGGDPDLWRSWWAANKDRPPAEVARREAPTTVAGPRYYGFAVRSSRAVFVLDVSRSMGWNGRLELARKELVQVLERLPARTQFTIIPFSETAPAWSEKLLPATPDVVRRAVRFVERLEPIGGTNSFEALRAAFADDSVDSIFFLSDGYPSVGVVVDPDEILAQVREMNRWRRVRIHAIALVKGEPPPQFAELENVAAAQSFMRRLAEENEGKYVEIR